jgi:hypothetical protein
MAPGAACKQPAWLLLLLLLLLSWRGPAALDVWRLRLLPASCCWRLLRDLLVGWRVQESPAAMPE